MTDHFDLFISYQRAAEETARQLYEGLTAAGFSVWQDVHHIRHTARWSVEIDHALRNAERLLLLLTPLAMHSDEVFMDFSSSAMIILSSRRETALRGFISGWVRDVKGLATLLNDDAMLDVRNKAAHDEGLSQDEARQTRAWAIGILGRV